MARECDITQLVRERETHRHLDHPSSVHAYVEATEEIPPARPTRHSVLTALAQLCTLRLRAQRTFISLFDHRYEYIVAETTSHASLRPPADHATEGGDVLFCGLAIALGKCLSVPALEHASGGLAAHVAAGGDKSSWQPPTLVIPDMHADERFSDGRLMRACPDLRFLASVPIRGSAGALIGMVSVAGDLPRQALAGGEESFLGELAGTVLDFLTMLRTQNEEARGKRMIRGLGSFVEGQATMSGLEADPSYPPQYTASSAQEGKFNEAQQARAYLEETEQTTAQAAARAGHVRDPTPSSAVAPPSPDAKPSLPMPTNTSSETLNAPDHATTSLSESPWVPAGAPPLNPHESTADDVSNLFSRAANTIRESIEVEGALFFDASAVSVDISAEAGGNETNDSAASSTAASSSGEDEGVRSDTNRVQQESDNYKACAVLGFSTTDTSSINGDKPSAEHLAVPERFLRLLLRRYPEGKIFNFDERGATISDSEPSDQDQPEVRLARRTPGKTKSLSRRKEPAFILRVVPGARSVLAFPLWDSIRSRWFAGGLVWTRTPTRIFSVRGELSYLRAFGSTVMAELARIQQRTENQAKSDVLGSISHELRTPLHGVLGGAELLLDTDLDLFQHSTVRTISRCGTTLLDTVDHLLDYAKVNNLLQAAKAERSTRQRRLGPPGPADKDDGSTDLVSVVDVSAIVEEVVESLTAGHEFEKFSQAQDADHMSPQMPAPVVQPAEAEQHAELRPSSTPSRLPQQPVNIVFNIHPATSWQFRLQAGALRRIVLNVFGNALKFTDVGQIAVLLRQVDSSNRDGPAEEVELTVTDTGKGIASEYLAHHLYTPFSQEDHLTPGIGLGLSTTHKLVTSLGGTIKAQSQIGKGTKVTILLRLPRPDPAVVPPSIAAFKDSVGRTKGLRLSLLGFDETTFIPSEEPKVIPSWKFPRSAVDSACREWLHMDVLPATESAITPDLYLVTPDSAQSLTRLNHSGVVVQPVVVLCPSARIARTLSTEIKTFDRHGVFEFIAQPCGPRKLAMTFILALDRWAAIQLEKASAGVPATPVFASAAFHDQVAAHAQVGAFPIRSHQLTMTGPSVPFHTHKESDLPPFSPSTDPPSDMPAPPPLQPTSSLASPQTSLSASSIAPYLVVDDNAINVKLLRSHIDRRGLPVAVATDGAAALETYTAARGVFSCIFMDIQMPRMDGIAATRAIREYEIRNKLQPVYVVVLTGLATKEKLQEAKASGANEFFAKPVKLKELNPILAMARRELRAEGG